MKGKKRNCKKLIEMRTELEFKGLNEIKMKFKKNKITIYDYFKKYLEIKKHEYKNSNKGFDTGKFIYDFLYYNLFIYTEKLGICKTKKMEKNKKIFLDYINEEIFIKYRLNKYKLSSNSKKFNNIAKEYFEKIYKGYYPLDEDFFYKKYWQFIKAKKNRKFEDFRIFSEMINYLTMYSYKYMDEELEKNIYMDTKFFNIIKERAHNDNEQYTFKDLVRFSTDFELLLECKDRHEGGNKVDYTYAKIMIFERIFPIGRLRLIINKILNEKRTSKTKLLILNLALNIQSVKLSCNVINKVFNKKPKLKEQCILILFYKQVFDIIDNLVDIMVKEKYISVSEFNSINKLYGTEKKCREYDKDNEEEVTKIATCHLNNKSELIFNNMKKVNEFCKKNIMNSKKEEKDSEKIYFETFEKYGEINFKKLLTQFEI